MRTNPEKQFLSSPNPTHEAPLAIRGPVQGITNCNTLPRQAQPSRFYGLHRSVSGHLADCGFTSTAQPILSEFLSALRASAFRFIISTF
jgi:hypothetical protein